MASTDERLRRVTSDVFEGWLDALAGRLAAAGISTARSRELAVHFVAALEGGFLLSRAAKDTSALDVLGHGVAELVGSSLP